MSNSSQLPPPSPPLQDRLLGTLIVIVLRAKNLPNRVRIGKQNPYATVTYGLHKKRTETIERGGQQPTWDAEFRFEILKDEFENQQLEAGGSAHVDKKGGVLPMSSKDLAGVNKLERPKATVTVGDGRRILKLACWADDNRDPRLIGEGELNIEETIKKGKFDDWVKLERKDRYAGEIYLELTWYSNEPKPATLNRPERSDSPTRSSYGGAGARLENEEEEDEGTEQDPEPRRMPHHQSQASLGNSSLNLAPDYPDPDLAPLSANHYPDADLDPLTQSMSSLSVGRPLPQPPMNAVPSAYAPPVQHSQSYNQLPPSHYPSDGYNYNQDRRSSFQSSVGPNGNHPQPPPPQSYSHSAPPPQSQPQYYYQPTPASYDQYQPPNEFGNYGEQRQDQYPCEPQQQQMGEFEQLAHQHYANQGYEQSSISSQRPLPQPGMPSYNNAPQSGAPSPHNPPQHYDQYAQSHSQPPPFSASYPPPLPQPPVPPIPPSTSVYWQKQQQLGASLPPSATYPNLPSSMSYQHIPQSVSHAPIHPSPSTPSFAQPPPQSFAPPPPSLSQSYSTPPHPHHQFHNPSFAPPPVFSPPPPPSLQQTTYGTLPHSQSYSPHQQHQTGYEQSYENQNGRSPLPPPPPTHPQLQHPQQQYRPY